MYGVSRVLVQRATRTTILLRSFFTSPMNFKELPRPSAQYMKDLGEQPIPLTEADIAAQEVADIDIPQATVDEKAEIKKQMKKRSLRMTFWQLFLITLLGSSTLNIMREKNLKEELDENFDKKFNVLEKLINDAEEGKITIEEARETMRSWNERFVDVFGLKPVEIEGAEGVDKRKLRLAFSKIKGIEFDEPELSEGGNEKSSNENKPAEKLNKFL